MRGFARVSAAVPVCAVADPRTNGARTIELLQRSHAQRDAVVVFPELGLTGYTARDLFADSHLLARGAEALAAVVAASAGRSPLAIVGLPLRVVGGIYNCAVAVQNGRVLAVVPKAYLPNHREFEEQRWFRSGREVEPGTEITLLGQTVPFGLDVLLAAEGREDLVVGIEVCEDLWVSVPPSAFQTASGATVVCNLSASNFIIGKPQLRRLMARSSSDRGICAYVYVAAGPGESSTDLAFDADAFICENGKELASSKRFDRGAQLVTADVDLEVLMHDRSVTTSFGDCAHEHRRHYRRIAFEAVDEIATPLRREVSRHPFVPADPSTLGERCWEIFEVQTNALATRMDAVGTPKLVLGVSGGLDSTHAALVSAFALDLVGRPRNDLICVSMPGLGTSAGTKANAEALATTLGAQFKEISVSEASRLTLSMVEHPAADGAGDLTALLRRITDDPTLGDVVLENVQARLRTLLLMTLANQEHGLVVGTGDLSEKALGWSTYAGDHIAMYDVNAGVPKTLIQSVIRWVAGEKPELSDVLDSILETPISPELLPAGPDGKIAQLTEDAIGPYELHDFFLYHLVRHGARPRRILDLAGVAFAGVYDGDVLKRWLRVFVRRFFRQQFKRSCTADAPKVGQVALSPRGDWRMPSDARVDTWLAEIDAYS